MEKLSVAKNVANIVKEFNTQISKAVCEIQNFVDDQFKTLDEIKENLVHARNEMKEIAYAVADISDDFGFIADGVFDRVDDIEGILDAIAPEIFDEDEEDDEDYEDDEIYEEDEEDEIVDSNEEEKVEN